MDNFHSLSSVVDESDPMLTGDLLNKYSNVSDFVSLNTRRQSRNYIPYTPGLTRMVPDIN